MTGKKPFSSIETVFQDHEALRHLQALVDAGCDRNELIMLMDLAFLADESWETQIGMRLRDFKGAITGIRHCADTIDRLNRSELIYRASIEHRIPGFVGLWESPSSLGWLASSITTASWSAQNHARYRRTSSMTAPIGSLSASRTYLKVRIPAARTLR